jgi:hypothetical protein
VHTQFLIGDGLRKRGLPFLGHPLAFATYYRLTHLQHEQVTSSLIPVSADILLGIFFDPENRGVTFL